MQTVPEVSAGTPSVDQPQHLRSTSICWRVAGGIVVQAVLSGEILYLSILCMTAPANSLTPAVLRKMLASDNGISTSHFQLYETGDGKVAITLNNFCKLQEMGPDDEDDILSCVSFLLADVVHAKDLIGADLHSA